MAKDITVYFDAVCADINRLADDVIAIGSFPVRKERLIPSELVANIHRLIRLKKQVYGIIDPREAELLSAMGSWTWYDKQNKTIVDGTPIDIKSAIHNVNAIIEAETGIKDYCDNKSFPSKIAWDNAEAVYRRRAEVQFQADGGTL